MNRREHRLRFLGSLVAWLIGSTIAYVVATTSQLAALCALSACLVFILDDLWRTWWRARCARKAYERLLRDEARVQPFSAADMKAYIEGIMRRNVN